MTTKLLTEQQVRVLHGLPQDALVAFFQAHGLLAEEPVAALLEEARERVADRDLDPDYRDAVLRGEHDKSHAVKIELAALRRGREIGLAERPTLTREMVKRLVIDALGHACVDWTDFDDEAPSHHRQDAYDFVNRLHAAIQERLQ